MSLEIRPITDEEVEQAEFITAYSFNSQDRRDLAPAVERAGQFYSTEWSLASFEDGEMTAFIRVIPFAMRLNGRALPFGAVGPVVSSPEQARSRQGPGGSRRADRERRGSPGGLPAVSQ